MRYLVQEGCIQPLCDLLGSSDAKIVPVALDAVAHEFGKGVEYVQRRFVHADVP